ncbi:GntR family transcriptional regulator [Lacimonas salitolerans]|uniref:GntR family transcriptional regulator n=1 Tax=Lacimonas salitolerans TaxID=1323750 RepID=A0ABW4EKF6_9RHOB
MTFHATKPRADDIADAIRKRICLQPQDEQSLLLEGVLADEFGVSRTPVRQALQRLAYEGLIDVRTGVGSVVSPLDPAQRGMHFAVHGELLGLVARLPDARVPQDIARPLGLIGAQDPSGRPMDVEDVYAVLTDLNALLSRLIPDPVIADAHLVSGWRIVRWLLADLRNGNGTRVDAVLGLCRTLRRSAENGRVALFREASDIGLAAGTSSTRVSRVQAPDDPTVADKKP